MNWWQIAHDPAGPTRPTPRRYSRTASTAASRLWLRPDYDDDSCGGCMNRTGSDGHKPVSRRARNHSARPWIAGLLLLAGLLGQPQPAQANARLESIKQHALALYTVSLADKRQLSGQAIVLLQNRLNDIRLQRTRVWLNDALWSDYQYNAKESSLLLGGAVQQLGLAPLQPGQHRIRLEIQLIGADGKAMDAITHSQTLQLSGWPLGVRVQLDTVATGAPRLGISPALPGADLLRAAEFELANGRAGRALGQLQDLAQFDPAMTERPEYSLQLAGGLQAWGLDRAAEAMYFQLAQSPIAGPMGTEALLQAAELALARGDFQSAKAYLDRPRQYAPGAQQAKRQILDYRIQVAGQAGVESGLNTASDAPLIWRYNLAVDLVRSGLVDAGAGLLDTIGSGTGGGAESRSLRDLANLKLGYLHLRQGQADQALNSLTRLPRSSPYRHQALLAKGWAEIATLAGTSPPPAQAGDLRPAFAQHIDRVMQAPGSKRAKSKALLSAVTAWSELRDGDPLEPAVQEALVAIPYALAQMGENKRAIGYGEIAVARLEAVRAALVDIHARTRQGKALDAEKIAASAWPPYPNAWQAWTNPRRWWLDPAMAVPDNAYMQHLLTDQETLTILQAMTVLSEAEALAMAAEHAPELAQRSGRLLQNITAERAVQQRSLNRFIWSWLDQQRTRTTRYLIMARLILGESRSRLDKTP